ncbi:MAG: CpaD family pilus assembly protein [Hyphomonadaceae bacterium]|nr:CpaD family pilus assembly protein [Hyphomonadaceae bacterium]
MSLRLSSVLVGLSAAASLGACASMPEATDPPVASFADRHVAQVTQTNQRLEIPVADNAAALTPAARSQISSFAGGYLRFGHGSLVMSTPSGAGNSDAAAAVAQQTRMALVESGVTYAAVAGSTYDASGQAEAPVVLTFTNYEAESPECAPLWEQDLAHQSNNQPWASFGCATQTNIAAMLEDPHDLLEPREMDPRDSGRRDAVMGHYRAGESTANVRTGDERATISTVAAQ